MLTQAGLAKPQRVKGLADAFDIDVGRGTTRYFSGQWIRLAAGFKPYAACLLSWDTGDLAVSLDMTGRKLRPYDQFRTFPVER